MGESKLCILKFKDKQKMEKWIYFLKFIYLIVSISFLLYQDFSSLMDSTTNVTMDKISLVLTYLTLMCVFLNLILLSTLHTLIRKKCQKKLNIYLIFYVALFIMSIVIYGFRSTRNTKNRNMDHLKSMSLYILHYTYYWAFTFEIIALFIFKNKLREEEMNQISPPKTILGFSIFNMLRIQVADSLLIFPHSVYLSWALYNNAELKPLFTTEYYKIGVVIMGSSFCFGLNSIILLLGMKKKNEKYISIYLYLKILLYATFTAAAYASERYKNGVTDLPTSYWTILFQLFMRLNFSLELVEILYYKAILKDRSRNQIELEMSLPESSYLNFDDLAQNTKAFLKEYKIPSNRIQFDKNCIAKGNFGELHFGHIKNSCWLPFSSRKEPVAVKILRSNGDIKFRDVLVSEIKSLSIADGHENFVKFFGVCWNHHYAAIVMEYCELGSMDRFLLAIRKSCLDADMAKIFGNVYIPELNKWALQIASAMAYLGLKKIIHGDLGTRNVLLDCRRNARVSDFGMSIRLYNYETYARSCQTTFPWRYMAPESLTDLKFSTKSDVYAFGVTLWEIYSIGEVPWSRYSWTSDFVQKLKDGFRLKKPLFASDEIYESIMCRCWQVEEDLRPDFQEIVKYFLSIQ